VFSLQERVVVIRRVAQERKNRKTNHVPIGDSQCF
jgi:hypothetical protein